MNRIDECLNWTDAQHEDSIFRAGNASGTNGAMKIIYKAIDTYALIQRSTEELVMIEKECISMKTNLQEYQLLMKKCILSATIEFSLKIACNRRILWCEKLTVQLNAIHSFIEEKEVSNLSEHNEELKPNDESLSIISNINLMCDEELDDHLQLNEELMDELEENLEGIEFDDEEETFTLNE